MEKNQVPWLERISYGLSDTGFNLMFIMMSTYLLFFYTDVFGVAAAVIAPIFLVGRLIDGVTDPFEGILMDKVHTRWGKIRPFWLWFSIPWGILAVLVFTSPPLGPAGKVIYIYITYLAFNAVLSLVSLPTNAILPSLTSIAHERTVVNVVRMVFSTVGNLVVVGLALPLVDLLGKTGPQQGYFFTAVLFSTIAVILFLNAFARTRERVQPIEEKPIAVKEGIKSLKNLPIFLAVLMVIVANLTLTIKSQSTIYYMQYNLNRPDLTPALLTVPNLFLLLTIVLSPLVSKRIGKRNACLLGIGISTIGSLIVLVSGASIFLLFAGTIICYMGLGFPAGMFGAMFADVVDYTEWKSRVRSTGLIYAGSSIGIKMGQGLGGALGAAVMALGNYIPNVTQSDSSLAALRFNFAWTMLIGVILLGVILYFYNVDKLYPQILEDLRKRKETSIPSQEPYPGQGTPEVQAARL
jgi:GPH family glycoside/pentoside/hexuronide:cation symporter